MNNERFYSALLQHRLYISPQLRDKSSGGGICDPWAMKGTEKLHIFPKSFQSRVQERCSIKSTGEMFVLQILLGRHFEAAYAQMYINAGHDSSTTGT